MVGSFFDKELNPEDWTPYQKERFLAHIFTKMFRRLQVVPLDELSKVFGEDEE